MCQYSYNVLYGVREGRGQRSLSREALTHRKQDFHPNIEVSSSQIGASIVQGAFYPDVVSMQKRHSYSPAKPHSTPTQAAALIVFWPIAAAGYFLATLTTLGGN